MTSRTNYMYWLDDLVDLYEADMIDKDKLKEVLIGHECVKAVKNSQGVLVIESIFGTDWFEL